MSNKSKSSKFFNSEHEFWTNGKRHFETLNIKKKDINFRKPESIWNLIDIKVKQMHIILNKRLDFYLKRGYLASREKTRREIINIINSANALRKELRNSIEPIKKNKISTVKERESNVKRKISQQSKAFTNQFHNSEDKSDESPVNSLVEQIIQKTVDKGDDYRYNSISADRNMTVVNITDLSIKINSDRFLDSSVVTDSQKQLIVTQSLSPNDDTLRETDGADQSIVNVLNVASNDESLQEKDDDSIIDGSVSDVSGTAEEHNQCVSGRIKSVETPERDHIVINKAIDCEEAFAETFDKTLNTNIIYKTKPIANIDEEPVTETVSKMNSDITTQTTKTVVSANVSTSSPPPPPTNINNDMVSAGTIDPRGADSDCECDADRTKRNIKTTKKNRKKTDKVLKSRQSFDERCPPDFWPKSNKKIVILSTENEEKNYMTYKEFYKRVDEELVEQIVDKSHPDYSMFRLRSAIKEFAKLRYQTPTNRQSQIVIELGKRTAFVTPPPKYEKGKGLPNDAKGFVQWLCPICEAKNNSVTLSQRVVSRFARIDNFSNHYKQQHKEVLLRELKDFNEKFKKRPRKKDANPIGCGDESTVTVTKTSKSKPSPTKRVKPVVGITTAKKTKLNIDDVDDSSPEADRDKNRID